MPIPAGTLARWQRIARDQATQENPDEARKT
jgi:hypothetical protein